MVRFEPDTVPMVARCSRGVTVEIDVPDDIAAGDYRGTIACRWLSRHLAAGGVDRDRPAS